MDPIRSRSSQTPSPSHSTASASASVTSSFHKRKLPPSSASAASYPYFSDNATAPASARDGAQDDLDTASARTIPAGGAAAAGGSFTSSEFEDAGDDDSDSMRVFTTARLESSGPAAVPGLRGGRPPKSENLKVEASEMKEERGGGHGSVGGTGMAVKEEAVKGIFTENIQTSGAYSAREEGHKREEDAGRLRFLCYANDGIDQHMIWLIGLKNIFARQLPNMPKEYIVRLVMDRSHKSMMVIRHNNVVGGITYRPYTSQKFGEIAFCAITGDEQVKGYGTRLMNHLKQHARDVDGLTHFLTYADNNAVGYFIKQGFTKEITFEKERWHGYIKDYDGGILMEYKIDPKLPYTDLSTMVRRQRQAIDERIRELSNCHIVYSGIDFQKKEAGIPRKLIKVEDIPGLREAGWTPDQWGHSRFKSSNVSADSSTYRQSLYSLMRNLLRAMIDHADAWPFKEPVDAREVPDYYDVIKDPMDLKIMSKRVDEQYYITLEMFIADARRMFANARTYNSPETIYYKCATRLEGFFSSRVHNSLAPGFKLQ